LFFDVNLNEDTNGSFCANRNHYPWGMDSSIQ
jgi:hypothetical protein